MLLDHQYPTLQYLGVAARVKERMQQVAAGKGPHRRPILLFPEGTTTNGRYLLRFRTGSFISGVPVQPIILKYSKVCMCGHHRSAGHEHVMSGATLFLQKVVCDEQQVHNSRLPRISILSLHMLVFSHKAGSMMLAISITGRCPVQSRVSPAWETISGAWHIFLMLATPLHTVTVYEVRQPYVANSYVSVLPP
jgi:Acyltransferase